MLFRSLSLTTGQLVRGPDTACGRACHGVCLWNGGATINTIAFAPAPSTRSRGAFLPACVLHPCAEPASVYSIHAACAELVFRTTAHRELLDVVATPRKAALRFRTRLCGAAPGRRQPCARRELSIRRVLVEHDVLASPPRTSCGAPGAAGRPAGRGCVGFWELLEKKRSWSGEEERRDNGRECETSVPRCGG